MKALLLVIALFFSASAALAAGCPPGTKHYCVQTKKGVQCYCR